MSFKGLVLKFLGNLSPDFQDKIYFFFTIRDGGPKDRSYMFFRKNGANLLDSKVSLSKGQ